MKGKGSRSLTVSGGGGEEWKEIIGTRR